MLFWIGVVFAVLVVLGYLTLVVLSFTGTIDRSWRIPLGYGALAVFAFAYFLFLGFPFDRILGSPGVAAKLDQMQRQNGMKIETGTVRGGWLFDVVAKDVRISSVSPIRRAGPADSSEPPLAQIEELSVRPAPLSLLTGKLGLHVSAKLYGGKAGGTIGLGRSSTAVDLSVSNVELAKYSSLADKWQMNVAGQIVGTVDLSIDSADASKSTGRIDLAIKNAMINESNPMGIQKIPRTVFDKGAGVTVTLKDGKASLDDVGLHGDDLDVTLDGDLNLAKQLAFSSWNSHATIKASDSFKSQVSLLDAFLGPGKGADGSYRYALQGTLSSPRPPRPDPKR